VGNYITTARASSDAVGLNTAQTNVTWTVNSSGLSLNAGGYAGTGTGFTGTNVSATITHNTAGLSLQLSAGGGGGGIAAGVSNTGHTAGNTGTFSSGTIVFAGSNSLTLSQSTGGANVHTIWLQPLQSALSGGGGISLSTIGSTIVIYTV
jgi:hypothetical protein